MARVLWRGIVARKVRVLLTVIAITLGVTLMAGTYVLTDTINASFAGIFKVANQGNAVVVTPHAVLGTNNQAQTSPITDAMLARVRAVPGVQKAATGIFQLGVLFDASGKRLNTRAPSFVSALEPAPFESFDVLRGKFPSRPGTLALDQATSDRYHLRVGDVLKVAGSGATVQDRIVGIVTFAGAVSFGGAGAVVMTPPEAQQVTGEAGRFDEIDVAATPGVTPSQLAARIRAALPRRVDVRTGTQQAAKSSSDLASNLGFLQTFLLVFAYVALFVGAFIIFNTFSITVAQRAREFGLLRTLGASRRQVLGSVVGESLLLGVTGSLLGLGLGLVAAPGLDQLLKSFGADLPDRGTVLETRTVIVSVLVGTLVTLVAGLAPALRATRVPPVAALREGVEIEGGRLSRYALPVTFVALAAGIALIVSGLIGASGALLLGIGALLVFVAVAALSPRFVPALAGWLSVLVVWRGITGRLARDNAQRQPGRTAVTAAALMIGLALVTFVSVVAAGTKASIDRAVDASFAGNLIVQNSQTASNQGIPAALVPALGRVPGVRTVAPVSFSEAHVTNVSGTPAVTGIDPASFNAVYKVTWNSGSARSVTDLGSTGVVLTQRYASDNNFRIGSRLGVLTPTGTKLHLVVTGIATDNARLLGTLTVNRSLAQSAFGQRDDAVDFLAFAPGVTNAQVQPVVNRLLRTRFPQAESQTAAQFKKSQAQQVNTLLGLIYALLTLAVVVSLFGIVNTLILSIYERTRELGMLRAVGTSRRQVRQMIRYESLITALIGAVIGLVVGILFAVVITRPLASSGFVLSIPVGTLVSLVVLAGLAGVAAAALPARRAARLNVLEAIALQ
ncbi:MAG TPA: FtsX-like permease family protein [Acidimicrobiales bacterium]|nr:FtsX-like permease family protein [Acidimicrobiales bacterium]